MLHSAQPYSAYRFNAMRWDSTSAQYDMGFRSYDPGLNQFLTRDMYNGALADTNLSTDPFTGNRYTYGGGNPISNIELDGHTFPGGAQCGMPGGTKCNPTPATSSSASGSSGGSGCGFLGLSCAAHFGNDFLSGLSNTGKQLLNGLGQSANELGSCGDTGNLSACKKFVEGYSDQSIISGVRNAWNNLSYDFAHGHAGAALGSIAAIGGLIWATKRLSDLTVPDAGAAGSAAAKDAQGLTINDAQFGAKIGKHAQDFGLNPADPAARQTMRDLINNIYDNPTEVRQGPWNPKGGGGVDYLFYRQGSDVVVTNSNNGFVTILKDGVNNGWFRGASPLG